MKKMIMLFAATMTAVAGCKYLSADKGTSVVSALTMRRTMFSMF